MGRLRPIDDRPAKKGANKLTTELQKAEKIKALCTIAKGALEKGQAWPDIKELLEQQMIIRWDLGATARRDYIKVIEIKLTFEVSKLMMQEKHK